jgi:membrane protein implicated in regulation of membrane protease activity
MLDGAAQVMWFDSWAWLFFIGVGLVLIILELFLGIDTGLDLVFIGTAFVLGGLITLAIQSWVWTALVSGVICLVYVFLGRRYIHRRMAIKGEKTNIDTIVNKSGVVVKDIEPGKEGLVKVGYEEWRARSEESLKTGDEITVTGVSGVTLAVIKIKGGTQ